MFEKKDLNMRKWILPAFAIGTLFMAACSESGKETAGTSEEAEAAIERVKARIGRVNNG